MGEGQGAGQGSWRGGTELGGRSELDGYQEGVAV